MNCELETRTTEMASGEVLGVNSNRVYFSEMNLEDKAVCSRLHSYMGSALNRMPHLRKNNPRISLANLESSYHTSDERYYVPLENWATFNLSTKQHTEASDAKVELSCEKGTLLVSAQMPSLSRSSAPQNGAVANGKQSSFVGWSDLVLFAALMAAVAYFYKSPEQMRSVFGM